MKIYVIDTLVLKKQEQFLGFRLTSAELDCARNSEGHVRVVRLHNGVERVYNLKLEIVSWSDLYDETPAGEEQLDLGSVLSVGRTA